MSLDVVRLQPSRGTEWLRAGLRRLQSNDPLRQVTVVGPSAYAGLFLRRTVAATGYAAVRFTTLPRLAESLGAARLGHTGHRPLTAVVQGALVRAALRSTDGPLAAWAEHAGLADLVHAFAAELRRRPDVAADVARIRASLSPTADAALAAVEEYERLRAEHHRYDDVDLLEAAVGALRSGDAPTLLADVGAILVYLAPRLDEPAATFLRALAACARVEVAFADTDDWTVGAAKLGATCPPPPVEQKAEVAHRATVTIAIDAVEESRSAVRDALAAMERQPSVPLYRQAIVYRHADTYGAVLRDALTAAGISYSSLDGRALADTTPARALLGLIRLREDDFGRASVLAWLSGLPDDRSVLRNQARWDQLSRKAGVVRGRTQWVERLNRLAGEQRAALKNLKYSDADPQVGRRRAMQRDITDADRIIEQIQAIDSATEPPAERTWAAHVSWLHRLRDEFLTPLRAWTDADAESAQLVGEIIDGLGAAGDVEPAVDVAVVLRALEDALSARRRPEGRMGSGIVIGPHRALRGFELDRVHILGVREGVFPSPLPPDPLLGSDHLDRRPEHEAGERRDWEMALASAADAVVVSAPSVDVDGRAVYPSSWLLELLAEDGDHPRASDVRSGKFVHPRLRHAHQPASGSTVISLAERREREAMRAHVRNVDVAGTALARRADLAVGRSLEVVHQRRSPAFTESDGNLIDAVATSPRLRDGLTARSQSATQVQEWATCPFRFLLGRVLSVAETDDTDDENWWRIDAAERGSLIHAILEDFFRGVATNGDPAPNSPYTGGHVGELMAIATRHIEQARARGVTGHPLVWANEQSILLDDLLTLLGRDAEMRAEGGWRPAFLEQGFGFDSPDSWPALMVPIDGGRAVSFRGYIDRVDRASGRTRVIDYKSGRNYDKEDALLDRLDRGRKLQLAIYAMSADQHWRGEAEEISQVDALYWYATSRGKFATVRLEVNAGVEDTLTKVLTVIDSGVKQGCFPQVPGEFEEFRGRWANCAYCAFDAVCPAGRDAVASSKRESPALLPYLALARDDGGDPAASGGEA